MKLDLMSDEALAEELERQAEIQRKHPPDSQLWMAASRIIHHLSREKRRRDDHKAGDIAV